MFIYAATVGYKMFFRKMKMRKLFLITILAGALVRSTQLVLVTGANRALGIPDSVFAIGDR